MRRVRAQGDWKLIERRSLHDDALEDQTRKAISFIARGGSPETWFESKDFAPPDQRAIARGVRRWAEGQAALHGPLSGPIRCNQKRWSSVLDALAVIEEAGE